MQATCLTSALDAGCGCRRFSSMNRGLRVPPSSWGTYICAEGPLLHPWIRRYTVVTNASGRFHFDGTRHDSAAHEKLKSPAGTGPARPRSASPSPGADDRSPGTGRRLAREARALPGRARPPPLEHEPSPVEHVRSRAEHERSPVEHEPLACGAKALRRRASALPRGVRALQREARVAPCGERALPRLSRPIPLADPPSNWRDRPLRPGSARPHRGGVGDAQGILQTPWFVVQPIGQAMPPSHGIVQCLPLPPKLKHS